MGPPRAAWKEVGVLRLARCELHQLFNQEWRQRYGALLVRFGSAQHSLAVLVHGPCFRYPCPGLHEVQTGDAVGQGFVDATQFARSGAKLLSSGSRGHLNKVLLTIPQFVLRSIVT
jgi:hypothetical protein